MADAKKVSARNKKDKRIKMILQMRDEQRMK
jgi:hypothetical protein